MKYTLIAALTLSLTYLLKPMEQRREFQQVPSLRELSLEVVYNKWSIAQQISHIEKMPQDILELLSKRGTLETIEAHPQNILDFAESFPLTKTMIQSLKRNPSLVLKTMCVYETLPGFSYGNDKLIAGILADNHQNLEQISAGALTSDIAITYYSRNAFDANCATIIRHPALERNISNPSFLIPTMIAFPNDGINAMYIVCLLTSIKSIIIPAKAHNSHERHEAKQKIDKQATLNLFKKAKSALLKQNPINQKLITDYCKLVSVFSQLYDDESSLLSTLLDDFTLI